MLALTVTLCDEVLIGEPGPNQIRVRLLEVRSSGRCRLGITADRSIPIFRSELLDERYGLPDGGEGEGEGARQWRADPAHTEEG